MAYFADYGNFSEHFQKEMTEQRRVGDLVKLIEGAQETVKTNMWTWLRSRQWIDKNPEASATQIKQANKSADAAMQSLIGARQEENRLWKLLFGIEDQRRAIEGQR